MAKQIVLTTCVMDCPDTCALEVEVVDGKIAHITGGRNNHPNTEGFICTKISRFAERVYHKERLLHPMKRIGRKGSGKFVRISWEQAVETITRRFRQIAETWGGEAILPYHYGGSNGVLGDGFMDHLYFARLGASRCAKTLCAAPTTTVAVDMYGKMPGVAFEDYPLAKFILIWGANPKTSNIHLVPYLKEARKNGAFIAVVDPRRNFSRQEVDLHLPVYPGADLPVALAMIRHWHREGLLAKKFLEKHAVDWEPLLAAADQWPAERAARVARVKAEDIIRLAEVYAERSPAVLRCGWGVERNRNGGQAVAAILAMPALLGKFGVRGGGYTLSNSGAVTLNREQVLGELRWNTRVINQSRLGDALTGKLSLKPPIKGLFVYNCNPVATAPHQNAVIKGLMRNDLFTVVFEQVMTDTALYADILLPATTFLEQQEIKKSYGSYVVGGVQPVIDPPGEAKPNEEVFAMLGRAMGWEDPPFHWDTETLMQKTAHALLLNGKKGDGSIFACGRCQPIRFGKSTPVQMRGVKPRTPDGKIHLTPPSLGNPPYQFKPVTSRKYPLAMISPATSKMISSTLGEFNYPRLTVTLNPEDAAARNIGNGDRVRVFNQLGEVQGVARISGNVRPGVVVIPKGAWRKASLNRQTATALCPSTLNPVGGGACFNDARVEVEKI
ncbi:MAG: molybdopterin oxidoreductase family protein [Calditrichaeota bacterium]|nr:MAG: molybdopterin oxidoreductase family protein [Calditrichota bacterium]